MNKFTLTVLGNDRPGIIGAISASLLQQACNIENVSQTILQNEFAGIFIVSAPEDLILETFWKRLEADLVGMGLHIHLKRLAQETWHWTTEQGEPFVVITIGPDRKGLVAAIAGVIAEYGVNILNLKAVFSGGDDPDKNMMLYELDVPKTVDFVTFRSALRERARLMGLDLTIQHRKIFDTTNRI